MTQKRERERGRKRERERERYTHMHCYTSLQPFETHFKTVKNTLHFFHKKYYRHYSVNRQHAIRACQGRVIKTPWCFPAHLGAVWCSPGNVCLPASDCPRSNTTQHSLRCQDALRRPATRKRVGWGVGGGVLSTTL